MKETDGGEWNRWGWRKQMWWRKQMEVYKTDGVEIVDGDEENRWGGGLRWG